VGGGGFVVGLFVPSLKLFRGRKPQSNKDKKHIKVKNTPVIK